MADKYVCTNCFGRFDAKDMWALPPAGPATRLEWICDTCHTKHAQAQFVPPLVQSGVKHDQGKLRYDLLPPEPIEALVKILTHGAEKYGPNNWQGLENFEDRYYAACLRHLQAWRKGELVDHDSGLPHLAHAMCCLTFLLWKELRRQEDKKFMEHIKETCKGFRGPA